MLTAITVQIFERDLNKLKDELVAYKNEADLWKVTPGISNSAGNLALHLLGNLNHFIGAVLGNTGYIRIREKEFSDKDIPRIVLLENIDALMPIIQTTLADLTSADLEKIYPFKMSDNKEMTTGYFLVHLVAHLDYHLGQINYHRRLLA